MSERANLASRLRAVRVDLYGEDGGPVLAAALGVPARTWEHYERGVVMPAHVLLRFLDVTGADPIWLLRGDGARYLGRGRGAAAPGPRGLGVPAG